MGSAALSRRRERREEVGEADSVGDLSVKALMRPAAVVKAEVSGNTRPGLAGAAAGVQAGLFVLDGFSAPRHEHLIAPAALAVHADSEVGCGS